MTETEHFTKRCDFKKMEQRTKSKRTILINVIVKNFELGSRNTCSKKILLLIHHLPYNRVGRLFMWVIPTITSSSCASSVFWGVISDDRTILSSVIFEMWLFRSSLRLFIQYTTWCRPYYSLIGRFLTRSTHIFPIAIRKAFFFCTLHNLLCSGSTCSGFRSVSEDRLYNWFIDIYLGSVPKYLFLHFISFRHPNSLSASHAWCFTAECNAPLTTDHRTKCNARI
jgi:hypothetical protein